MSDHTDDSPRERYEGPMASAAKAETRDCEACGGHGYRWKSKGTDRYTYSCECTGVPDVPIDEPFTVPDSEFRKPNATGHDGCIRGLEKANATIAERAAEIERLKHDVDALKFDTGTLTADRDTLRLEVQRLKDLNFEAQDRYAALEAERDALKAQYIKRYTENADGTINMLRDQVRQLTEERDEVERERNALLLRVAEDVAPVEAERDALKRALDAAMRTIAAQNAQVRAMNEQLDAVTQLIVQQVKEATHE